MCILQASIYSYLPSLTSGCIDNADLEKIQYIISEHHQLKGIKLFIAINKAIIK